MPARERPTRDGSARVGSARRSSAESDRKAARSRARATADERARAGRRGSGVRAAQPGRAAPRPRAVGAHSGDGLVVGATPSGARIAGGLLVLAGLLGIAALLPPYLVVDDREISLAAGVTGVLAAALTPLVSAVVGVLLALGRVPRFGLAYAGIGSAPALGSLLIELYRGSSSTLHPGEEVLAGEWVVTSSVQVAGGWVLGVAALGLTVLAGACAAAFWSRTVMEDRGALDPARPGLAGLAALLGVGTVLCLALPAADVPDRLVTDPGTGLQTVVQQPGPQALLERPGLALLGGLLLAGAVVLCSALAPSLRPRLATVGGLLAIAVVVLSLGLAGVRDAVVAPELEWTLPGAGLLVAGLGYAGLTALAWRLRRRGPAAG